MVGVRNAIGSHGRIRHARVQLANQPGALQRVEQHRHVALADHALGVNVGWGCPIDGHQQQPQIARQLGHGVQRCSSASGGANVDGHGL